MKNIKKLGWRKIKTKYCQFVREKNQVERVLYAHLCQARSLDFNDSIFIDETTRQCGRNAPLQWFHNFSDETRGGLIPKYSH